MFGQQQNTNSFGSFGSTNNNQSTFGQAPTAFGSSPTATTNASNSLFGGSQSSGSSLFNKPATTTTGGGLFGGGSTLGSGTFGGTSSTGTFGATSNSTLTPTTSSFGASNPATASGSLFGKPATTTFGGGSAFGSSTSPFGASSSFGAPATSGPLVPPGQGTATVRFEPFTEKDGNTANAWNSFQSISCMPQYINYSVEELRWQDYQQGRRYGTGAPSTGATGSFGLNTSPFGASNTSPGAFGSTSGAFGSNPSTNPAAGGSVFGGANTGVSFGSSGFGSAAPANTSAGSLFGQKPQTTSPFGQTNPTGAFGSSFGNNTAVSSAPASNAFGQTATTSGGFGGFGGTSNSSSLFGSSTQNTALNTAQKPVFGFGGGTSPSTTTGFGTTGTSTNTGGGLFGSSATAGTGTSPFGSSTFGSTTQPQNTASTGTSLFGQQSKPFGSTGFGSTTSATGTTTGGTFGQPASTTGSSLFGQPKAGGSFGFNTGTTTGTTGSSASPFGATNSITAPAAGSGTGLFGNTNNNTQSSGLFSAAQKPAFGLQQPQQQQTQQQGQTTNSLFGNGGSTFGSFGNATNNSNTNTLGGSSFGSKPFGASGTTAGISGGLSINTGGGPSLFGQTSNQTGSSPSSLFNKPATTGFGSSNTLGGSSLFGNNLNQTQGTNQLQAGQSLFGTPQQQQPRLVATIDDNPYGYIPHFPGNVSVNGSGSGKQEVPLAVPLTGSLSSSGSGQPKKYTQVSAYKLGPKPLFSPSRKSFSSSPSTASVKPSGPSPSSVLNAKIDQAIMSTEMFSPRGSIRRLVIDSKARHENSFEELFGTPSKEPVQRLALLDAPATPSPLGAGTSAGIEDGRLKPASTQKQNDSNGINDLSNGIGNGLLDKDQPSVHQTSIHQPSVHQPSEEQKTSEPSLVAEPSIPAKPDNEIVDEDGYWISPSQNKLDHMSIKDLEAVKGFKVGRVGFGYLEFLEPVDLTQFFNVSKQIPGVIVAFVHSSCVIYPNDEDKPPKGKGLNLPVRITLQGVWAKTKDKMEPIKDPNHPLYKKHLARLRQIPGTKFISFDATTGSWVFDAEN